MIIHQSLWNRLVSRCEWTAFFLFQIHCSLLNSCYYACTSILWHFLDLFEAIHRMEFCTCWIVIAESNLNQKGFSHVKITLI